MNGQPRITGRPKVPDGYGVSDEGEYLPWELVEARLRDAVHYWVASTRPDGRSHVVPRWGVWVDHRFWYDGSPKTRHARNLASNPAVTLHLEDGSAATIVEGKAAPSDPLDTESGAIIAAEFKRKYGQLGYSPTPDSWSDDNAGGLLVFEPAVVIAWSTFPDDLTRFVFT